MKKGKAPSHGTSENEGKAWGHGQFANMPQEVMMKPYPSPGLSTDDHLDDTIQRIDSDTKSIHARTKKSMDKGMY